jgi:hypothetical protein
MTPPWEPRQKHPHPWGSSMEGAQAGFPTTQASVTGAGQNPVETIFFIDPGDVPLPTGSFAVDWPPNPTTLLTASTSNLALAENTGASSYSPSLISPDGSSSTYDSLPTGNYPFGSYPPQQPARHHPPIVAIAVAPIVLLIIIGALVFFCMRRHRKQKQAAATQAQEMKATNPTIMAYESSALPSERPLSRDALRTNLTPASLSAPQPVILGPISGSNSNYFTGIDTSDITSVRSNERAGLGNPFADSNSVNEEPPPPYYANSIGPLSRDASLRVSQPPPPAWSQTALLNAEGQPVRSPFDDPTNGDAVSDISGPTLGHDGDNLSAVSDLSYQQDPVVGRPTV